MTAAVALAGAAEPDALPSFPAAALVAKLLEACAAGAAVGSAIDLGVVRIEAGPVASDRVAADCGLTEQGAESLLAALAALGLVARGDDGRFRPAFSRLTAFAELLRPWGSLPLALRGEWRAADAATTAGAERLYPNVVGQLALLFREGAQHAAVLLPRTNARVLDIGAGAAPWSLALAARNPDCKVTAVELPAVMASTRAAVRAARLERQYVFVEGDAFDVAWGEPASFDLALVGNLCHLFDEEANVRLLRRVAEAVQPGGTVAVVDILASERGDGPRAAALYALGLVRRTARGRIYPYSAFCRWLIESGFADHRRHRLTGPFSLSLITGRRR